MNLPNLLTIIRFLLIPLCGYSLYTGSYIAAGIIFVLACLTDMLDGHLARKYNLITDFGKLADPAADKLLLITVLFILAVKSLVPYIVPILVLVKELILGVGGLVLLKKKYVVSANIYGKLAAVFFNISVAVIIIFEPGKAIVNPLLALCIIFMLLALIVYTVRYFEIKADLNEKD